MATFRTFLFGGILGCLLGCFDGISATEYPIAQVQDSLSQKLDSIAKSAENLYQLQSYQQLISATEAAVRTSPVLNQNDSLNKAQIYFVRAGGFSKLRKLSDCVAATTSGIAMCPNTAEGLSLKAKLYNRKAWAENDLGLPLKCRRSILTAIDLLNQEAEPNLLYLVGSYLLASTKEAYYGDIDAAKRYLRLSQKFYEMDKVGIEKERREQNNNYDRLELMLPYRKTYLLWKLGTTVEDSLELEATLDHLRKLRRSPEFSIEYESQYYTTGLNHAANWYIGRKADSLIQPADIDRAYQLLDEAIDLVDNQDYNGPGLSFKYNLCKTMTLAGEFDQADSQIEALLNAISETDPRRPFFLAQKGLIKAHNNEKQAAIKAFHEAVSLVHQGSDTLGIDYDNFEPSEVFGATEMMVKIADKLDRFYPKDSLVSKRVASLYQLALKQFNNSYANKSFNPKYNQVFRKIIGGMLKMKQKGFGTRTWKLEDLLNETETVRNQLAWKRFHQNRFTNSLPELDAFRQRKLLLRTQLVQAKKSANIATEDSIQQLINQHEVSIQKRYPNVGLLSDAPFNIVDLQQQLNDQTLIIKYLVLQDQLAVFSISKHDIDYKIAPWQDTEIELLQSFISQIKSQEFQLNSVHKLSRLLLPDIKNYQHIIINPDDQLFRAPFEVLQTQGQYLFQRHTVHYTSNLRFINPTITRPDTKEELAVYVPDYGAGTERSSTRTGQTVLEGAKKEAKAIGQFFKAQIYDDQRLSKEDFVATASRTRLLHLAMHAVVNNEQSELSRFLFDRSGEAKNDLYLEEIYGLSLRADMAVLSACNTGLGKENAGKSLESFQRAFTFAGVPATVASLWEVPDLSTREIMESFYKNLKAGQTKSEALSAAKLSYIANHKNTLLSQPYYWAGFVLYGDDTAIRIPNQNIEWYLLVILILLLFMALWIWYKKQRS